MHAAVCVQRAAVAAGQPSDPAKRIWGRPAALCWRAMHLRPCAFMRLCVPRAARGAAPKPPNAPNAGCCAPCMAFRLRCCTSCSPSLQRALLGLWRTEADDAAVLCGLFRGATGVPAPLAAACLRTPPGMCTGEKTCTAEGLVPSRPRGVARLRTPTQRAQPPSGCVQPCSHANVTRAMVHACVRHMVQAPDHPRT